jgi:hypothetical protein
VGAIKEEGSTVENCGNQPFNIVVKIGTLKELADL